MKAVIRKSIRVVFVSLIITSFLLTIFQAFGIKTELTELNYAEAIYNNKEDYSPSLQRLNSIAKLEKYCDSVFFNTDNNYEYPQTVCSVIRQRFYHGYSHYGFDNNYMALVLEPFTGKQMSAIVLTNDILKYKYAACSQQSLVAVEILKRKGYTTRNVILTGHFCYEVFYKDAWHFFDPDMEPDAAYLDLYSRPSIAELKSNEYILLRAYKNTPAEMVISIFNTFNYENVSGYNAMIYQKTTNVLSNIMWLILIFIHTIQNLFLINEKPHRRNSMATPIKIYTMKNNVI